MRKGAPPPHQAPERAKAEGQTSVQLRALCHRLLVRVHGGAHLGPILQAALTRTPWSAADRGFATELCQGTLRHQAALDAALSQHLRDPIASLPPPVRVALRLGAYQLRYTRTSAHAAVDTSVALVAKRYGRLRHVCNAVLRAIARDDARQNDPTEALAPFAEDTLPAYATALSHPQWFVRALAAQWGFDQTLQCLRASNERPLLHVRINTQRIAREAWLQSLAQHKGAKAKASPVQAVACAVIVEQSGPVSELPGYAEGMFCVQDAAAQAVGLLADPDPRAQILDACAAPGGKTTHLLERLLPGGRVVAVDCHEGRLRRVVDNANRMQLHDALVVRCLDLTCPEHIEQLLGECPARFSCVVLDAPCSGMGTLRRHPELRTRDDAHLPELLALQALLLRRVAALVAPGGRLVYSVCSPLHAEGREQAEHFVASQPAFAVEALPPGLAPLSDGPYLSTYPHRHGMDGFFACRFVRDSSLP